MCLFFFAAIVSTGCAQTDEQLDRDPELVAEAGVVGVPDVGSNDPVDVVETVSSTLDASPKGARRDSRAAAFAIPVYERIRARFGEWCHLDRMCGGMWGIDCLSAVDGPYYYVVAGSLEVISKCGGYCFGQKCLDCPPLGWKCSTF